MLLISTCSNGTTRGIEVHVDRLGRVFRFKKQKLSNNDMRGVVRDGSIDANDAFLEKTREDIVGSFTSGRGFNDHWDQTVGSISAWWEFRVCSVEQEFVGE